MRQIFIFLFIANLSFGQPSTKKILIEGKGSPVVLLAGGRWDMKSFTEPAAALSHHHLVIRMEHFNVQYANEGNTLPADYSLKAESEAIGKTLDSMGIHEPVILVGWSFGALANQLANWLSSRPDMTSFGAALNETATGPPLTPADPGHALGMPV